MTIPRTALPPFLTLSCAVLMSLPAPAAPADEEPIPVLATTYYGTFSHAHPVLARIRPGETIATKTIDAGGLDEKLVQRSELGNPLTGPFAVEGAEPGDALIVHLKKVRCNRNSAWSTNQLHPLALTPEGGKHLYSKDYKADLCLKGYANLVPWDIDLARNVVRLREPVSKVHPMEFPTHPILGCIGVAAKGDLTPAG